MLRSTKLLKVIYFAFRWEDELSLVVSCRTYLDKNFIFLSAKPKDMNDSHIKAIMENGPLAKVWYFKTSFYYYFGIENLRISLSVLLCLLSLISFSQNEADNWYFGRNAGLSFATEPPTVLMDGQLNTSEGCSTISDSDGNLLLYSDGRTVWDRNHSIMPNGNYFAGTGLKGDPSSSQSAIIVPNPANSNIYYIFTVDEPHHENAAVYPAGFVGDYIDSDSGEVPTGDDGFNNGFNYSVVDLNVIGANGSIGDVVSSNNHLVTYNTDPNGEEIKYKCSEKIAAVRHGTDNAYWVVTHFVDKFYAYKVDGNGVNTAPVISQTLPAIPVEGYRKNALGYLKISHDGNKLAICYHQSATQTGTSQKNGFVYLYDFDDTTGLVSNPVEVLSEMWPYGVEFSPSVQKLYVTAVDTGNQGNVYQFDLTQTDIKATKTPLFTPSVQLAIRALQLAKNGKIYMNTGFDYLSVINNPDGTAVDCDFQYASLYLGHQRFSAAGLPPFISSFFNTAIQFENNCLGDITSFSLNSNETILSATWNFGEGNVSTVLSPDHTYASAGTYTVSVTATSAAGIATNTREITIHPLPVLNANSVNLKQCDDDNDGYSAFNLNEVISLVVNDTTGLTFSFHETLQEAKDNANSITSETSYTNQTVSNDVVFIRVENANGCYQTAQINLQVSTTLIPSTFQKAFTVCDDVASGNNMDGIATFDFSSVTPEIQALYPAGQLLAITYYRNLNDALAETNAILDISNYTNIGYPNTQDMYVRVDSQVNNECLGLGHHITLNVETIPIVQSQIINHCDDDQDGLYGFDTTDLESTLLNGLTNVSVSYTDENNNPLPSPLPNPFITTAQTLTATITNLTPTACSFSTTIEFVVDDLPEIFTIPTVLTSVCDDETDPALQDGIYPFDTAAFEAAVLGNQTGMEVLYFDENGNPLPSPLPNPFVSGTQTITVEVINPINTSCFANATLPLIVHPTPIINLLGEELICSDNPNFTKTIDAGLLDVATRNDYTYKWFFNGVEISSETGYSLVVNTEGVYEAEVQNTNGCIATRTITVTSSNKATIEAIEVIDLSDHNSITVLVTGLGDYVYSLDNENFQESNTFYNLEAGIYTVYVKDLNRCGTIDQGVSVLGIPKFFTPNGDGYNDYWNIKGTTINLNSKAVIAVFDRYGKLLQQFNPSSSGWDGTFNGASMPSSDYWYMVQLEDGRTVKGHFSLKR